MSVLITGGAGYIGSHMVHLLLDQGITPIVVDDLSKGNRSFIPDNIPFYQCNVGDKNAITKILQDEKIGIVMHFAANTDVGESVQNPTKYIDNNFVNTLNLLESMRTCKINKLIFSSTAAVFGENGEACVTEFSPKNPVSPYGKYKLWCEQLFEDYHHAYGFKTVSLRYFNAASADPKCRTGFQIDSTQLIPRLLKVAIGKTAEFHLFGDDYNTADGTCVRDFIHVLDLCRAHLLAMKYLMAGGESLTCNLGTGHGYSVAQVINKVEQVSKKHINVIKKPRREGDLMCLVADSKLADTTLGWQPQYGDLETMIRDAWMWVQHVSKV